MWPALVDMSKEECKRALRSLELETYSNVVSVLRAQGALGPEKRKLLQDVATALNIPLERHKAEIRKAVNDEKLNTIAEVLFGPHTATEWAIEGRRLVPLLPREPPKTVFSIVADQAASLIASENSRLGEPSETANKGSELPLILEPSSPEATKTQARSISPSGVLVLPSGTAIQMKREPEDEELMRKRRRFSVSQESNQQTVMCPSSSPPSSKVIIVSSSGSPGTSSILQKTLSVPMKTVPSNSKPTVIYAQSIPHQVSTTTSVVTDSSKVRMKPAATASTTTIPKPRPGAVVVSNQGASVSPQTLQLKSPKPGGTGTVAHLKTALQTTKHTVPIQTIAGMQVKAQSPQTKILVQQKATPRTLTKTVQQKNLSTPQQKTIHHGKSAPVGVVLQQKTAKGVVTNVQVKTPQGFANVPIHLRTATKSQALQIKHDSSGNMKMLSISGGTKILPKPSQPVYMVATSSSPLSMVTRTIPASSSPRVVAVSSGTGTPVKTSQTNMFTSNKPVQTVHVMTQSQGARRQQNVVVFQKGPSTKSIPITQTGKEIVSKVVMPKGAQSSLTPISKPVTTLSTSALAQSLQNLPVAQTQSGSVILVDLSNQESMTKNAAIAELLQASGLLGDAAGGGTATTVTEKTKRLSTGESAEMATGDESQILEVEEKELKSEEETTAKEETPEAPTVPNLSIEEAVEMLNRSDTPETRALLSQAGIQISDEIGDSEEDEILEEKTDTKEIQEQGKASAKDEEEQVEEQLPSSDQPTSATLNAQTRSSSENVVTSTSSAIAVTTSLTTTRPRAMDIFSTALASANINLDNFMEEEDEPEQMLVEMPKNAEERPLTSAVSETITTQEDSQVGNVEPATGETVEA